MMSCQVIFDVRSLSDQAAVPRGVRPGPETPALVRFLRRPHLLERRPVIGRALRPEEAPAECPLEADVHLEPAVVGAAAVPPTRLEAVDAKKCRPVRRVGRPPPRLGGTPLPEQDRFLDVRNAHLVERPALGWGPAHAHEVLPAPGRALVGVDLSAEPGNGPSLLQGPNRLRTLCCRSGLCCASDRAATAREQAGAGQGESPQITTPSGFACQS